MKSRLILLLFFAILWAANPVQAESKILLRLNLQKGSIYEMTLVTSSNIDQEMMGQKMKIDQKMEMVFTYEVMDILPNHNFQIDFSIVKTKLSMNINGKEVDLDSESKEDGNAMISALKDI